MIVRLGVFSSSAVSRLGREHGLFDDAGVQLVEHRVQSSVHAFQDLDAGGLDVLLTSPDNVLAYRLNKSNALGRKLDVQILRGADRGLGLSLMAGPAIKDAEQLRGRDLGVDAAATGFAYTLYALMHQLGMTAGRDYRVVEQGTTPARREALLAGRCSATMLNAGNDVVAEQVGCDRLLRVSEAIGPYLGSVLVARRTWSTEHRNLVARLLDAWTLATELVLDDAQAPNVREMLATMLSCSTDVAEKARQILIDPHEGLLTDGSIDGSLQTVVDLRAANNGFDDATIVTGSSANDLGLSWQA
ncbi:MAG TPA: PhnD/SsuA/transferrin family substrate-binding protein [Jatrophihabitans sp.]|jgi:ABC-type nitrate/sulfonate/bicarbonate transport system substrate-binding protein